MSSLSTKSGFARMRVPMPSESRWRIQKGPPANGRSLSRLLTGVRVPFNAPSLPLPSSLQFRRRSGKGCVSFVPISNPILPLNSDLSDIGIELITAFLRRISFEISFFPPFCCFISALFEKIPFRIPSNRKFVESFAFFLFFSSGNSSAFREFFTFTVIFLSSLDRRLDNNNARELLFRGIDREAGRFFNGSPRVDGTRKRGNERVDQMTSSRQREGPPAKGVHGGRGGGRGLVAGTIVAVPRGGSSRLNGPSPWEAPRRPFSLYNFNSRVDDFASWSERANTRSLSFLSFPSVSPLSFLFSLFFFFATRAPLQTTAVKATWLF